MNLILIVVFSVIFVAIIIGAFVAIWLDGRGDANAVTAFEPESIVPNESSSESTSESE